MHRTLSLSLAVLLSVGCFPTYQSARVDPGFKLDVETTYLGDHQQRYAGSHGADYIIAVTPSYGFNSRLELGAPTGAYAGEKFSSAPANSGSAQPFIMPYAKLALWRAESKNHLAAIFQTVFFAPSNLGLRYGRDLNAWEPEVGVTRIFSSGSGGDPKLDSRFQQTSQSLILGSIGATIKRGPQPAFEIGVLKNKYRNPIQQTQWLNATDLFFGLRINAMKEH